MAKTHRAWANSAVRGKAAVRGHIHFDTGRLKPLKKLAAGAKPLGRSTSRSATKGK